MNLERVGAVFQIVGLLNGAGRQLSQFTCGHKPGSEPVGDRGAQDEPPTFDADHQIDLLVPERLGQPVEHLPQPDRVTQQGRNVVIQDARFRKVRHLADLGF